jgi:hypothetical protein
LVLIIPPLRMLNTLLLPLLRLYNPNKLFCKSPPPMLIVPLLKNMLLSLRAPPMLLSASNPELLLSPILRALPLRLIGALNSSIIAVSMDFHLVYASPWFCGMEAREGDKHILHVEWRML